MLTSHKVFYIMSLIVCMAVAQSTWNLFNRPHDPLVTFYGLGTVTLNLFMFVAYVCYCLLVSRQIKADPLSFYLFIILTLGVISVLLLGFAQIFAYFGLIYTDNGITHDSLECLYFSIITFTTVGYGDFRPTPDARLYAGLEAITGVLFFSLFISTLVHVTNTQSE